MRTPFLSFFQLRFVCPNYKILEYIKIITVCSILCNDGGVEIYWSRSGSDSITGCILAFSRLHYNLVDIDFRGMVSLPQIEQLTSYIKKILLIFLAASVSISGCEEHYT